MAEKQEQQQQEGEAALAEEQANRTAQDEAQAEESEYCISEAELFDDLQPLAAQWRELGIQLRVPTSTLDRIQGQKSMCLVCLLKIIQQWLETGPHTKDTLVEVLKRQSIGEHKLAKEISDNKKIPEKFDTKSIDVLCNILSGIAHKYSTLGLQLLGSLKKVKEIEKRVTDVQGYLNDTILEWMSLNEGELKLSEILKAIRSPVIDNPRLAQKLETKWKPDPTPAETPGNEVTADDAEGEKGPNIN